MGKMDANLMGSTCVQSRGNAAVRPKSLPDTHTGECATTIASHSLLRALSRVATNGRVEIASRDHSTFHKRLILATNATRRNVVNQGLVRSVASRDYQQP